MKPESKSESTELFRAALSKLSQLIDQGRLPEALDAVNKLIKLLPSGSASLALPLSYRGQIYGRTGNLPAALADLEESVRLGPTAEAFFNLALAHLHSNDKKNGLAALFRVVQLEPGDAEAQSLRDTIAIDLGLQELSAIAKTVERFVYPRCGPGFQWMVDLRQMHRFLGNGTVENYNAAVLDLCQQPVAFVQIRAVGQEYVVIVNSERTVPGVTAQTMVDELTKVILAEPAALTQLLTDFISEGVLIQDQHRLRHADQSKTAA